MFIIHARIAKPDEKDNHRPVVGMPAVTPQKFNQILLSKVWSEINFLSYMSSVINFRAFLFSVLQNSSLHRRLFL